jgi:pre-mRNA-splicing factor 38A
MLAQDMHIHGMNPQHLIETILRGRIYECVYWKTHCFALNAESFVDKAVELRAVGGHYSNQKPTDFICLVLKLLEIAPEPDIIKLFISTKEFKYLIALGAFYLRLTGSSKEIYETLEPLLNDKRKLRFRQHGISDLIILDGKHVIIFMDVFIDDLLRKDRVFDTILPRLTKRHVLEELGDLEPRVSSLEQELLLEESDSSESSVEEIVQEERKISDKKEWSKKKVKSLFKQKSKSVTPVASVEIKKDSESLSIEETNRIRVSLGLKPLKQ